MYKSLRDFCLLFFPLLLAYLLISTFLSQIGRVPAPTKQIGRAEAAQVTPLLGKPSITAVFIDQILCAAQSPACRTGQDLYSLGERYGIDPAYALAFFQHESTFGKFGVAASNLGLGNIRCTDGYVCKHGFRAYKTWAEGYEDWYRLIRYLYIEKWGLITVEQIVPVYAPAKDNNNPSEYIRAVIRAVQLWRKGSVVV